MIADTSAMPMVVFFTAITETKGILRFAIVARSGRRRKISGDQTEEVIPHDKGSVNGTFDLGCRQICRTTLIGRSAD